MTLSAEAFGQTRRERGIAVLETARLTLRPPCRSDVKAIVKLANDRRIAENTARIPHPYSVAHAREFIGSVNKRAGEACFLVTLDDAPIGACGIDPRQDGPEIGYWLGVQYWGRGLATEAVRALIDHAFGDLQHETLHAGARVGCWRNAVSNGPASACGGSAPSIPPRRSIAFASIADCGRRLNRGAGARSVPEPPLPHSASVLGPGLQYDRGKPSTCSAI
jgi:RimJ/RimL family protein N-acetyltransferase